MSKAATPHAAEADIIREAYQRKKRSERITQEKIADALDVTQGFVGGWLSGRKRVPDKKLLALGLLLGFDALEVRPTIAEFAREVQLLSEEDRTEIESLLSELTKDEKEQAEAYIRFLLSQR